MSAKVLYLATGYEPAPREFTYAEKLLAALDEERAKLRKVWRRDGRASVRGPRVRRCAVSVGEPPTWDLHALLLWSMAVPLLVLAESAFDRANCPRVDAKVLRRYVRNLQAIVRQLAALERKHRPSKRATDGRGGRP